MKHRPLTLCFSLLFLLSFFFLSSAQAASDQERHEPKDKAKLFGKTGFCIDCHQDHTPGIFSEWVNSTHARVGVGCADCHGSSKGEPNAILHQKKYYISTVVTPFDCSKCHKEQMRDYFTSGHAKALDLLQEMKETDPRYPVVAQYKDDDFKQCSGCHGVKVTLNPQHQPDPATWPNSGAGRINPDNSHGTCSSCHLGHRFSASAARQPETCLRCHDGANYPEGDIYRHSTHGVAYETLADKEALDKPGYYFTGSDMVSPTCAFCHLNGSGHELLTRHNPAWRLPRDLTSPTSPLVPERSDNLRKNMKAVCNQCHASSVIGRFFKNADEELAKYQKTVVEPRLADYQEKLAAVSDEERKSMLKEYADFLAEAKAFRMNIYMGRHGKVQR